MEAARLERGEQPGVQAGAQREPHCPGGLETVGQAGAKIESAVALRLGRFCCEAGKLRRDLDRIAVDADRIRHLAGVAACKRYDDRNFLCPRLLEHHAIALFETFQAELQPAQLVFAVGIGACKIEHHLRIELRQDRKSTRLNSSHMSMSYAVFCLKKKRARTAPAAARGSLGSSGGSLRRPPGAAAPRRRPLSLHDRSSDLLAFSNTMRSRSSRPSRLSFNPPNWSSR